MIYENILETIGHTPIVHLKKMSGPKDADIYAKIESFNPAHSVKDRTALAMIEDAESTGAMRKDMFVVEPTSGNTGIGLAMVCASKGYRLLIVMPDSFSIERQKLMKAFGAELILTPGKEGMSGAINYANELVSKDKNAFMPQQFENLSNPMVHYRTTAREIVSDIPELDAFVCAVGTGGTISGVSRFLKEHRSPAKIIGVEPEGSPVLSGGKPGPHKIQGIGAGFIPKVCDVRSIDRTISVKDDDAIMQSRELAKREGVMAGISSGAALFAARSVASEMGRGKKIVVLLPDTGERYLSTELFS